MNQTARISIYFAVASALTVAASATSWAKDIGVGPQYDTTHVYVEPGKLDPFVDSILKTFGGKTTQRVSADVTPTPSQTYSQLILTPSGSFSVFDFQTPVPYPFGNERNGFLVTDMDAAIASAKKAGADVIVEPFNDPIGRDAVVQWPGGVNMQLYWHTKAPNYQPLSFIPENRIYLSRYRVDDFIKSYQKFSNGKVIDDSQQSSTVIGGEKNSAIRVVNLSSAFGKTRIFVTDGHLNYPFGQERTGYGVANLSETLGKATASGAKILWQSVAGEKRASAVVQFPGGYIAEIHQDTK